MAILLYQIGIFLAIQIAAIFGKRTRNFALILISIFTVIQVFMSWLLLLQFFTILISYSISNSLFFRKKIVKKVTRPTYKQDISYEVRKNKDFDNSLPEVILTCKKGSRDQWRNEDFRNKYHQEMEEKGSR